MTQEKIRKILSAYDESGLTTEVFPLTVSDLKVDFNDIRLEIVEEYPLGGEDEDDEQEYWLVISATAGKETTFWKIPGYYYDEDDYGLEPENTFKVRKGKDIQISKWKNNDDKDIPEETLYPFAGVFWIELGADIDAAVAAQRKKKVFKFQDLSVRIVDVKYVGYDEGENGYAIAELTQGENVQFIKVAAYYDSQEGFHWSPSEINIVDQILVNVHNWIPIK